MKPKDRRTCGNCANGSRVIVSCWERDDQGEHHAPNEPACPEWLELRQYGMCSCSKSRGYDELEQRYAKIAKLAQDMHRIIASAERNGSTICDGVSARLLERMGELGVEADG